jgi:colicin import membrane protein
MKRKVKKFGSGGDIVTGLGAVLLGKALYDKYNESKSKDASTDSPAKIQTRTETKAAPPFADPRVDEKKTEAPAANKDEVREAGRQRAVNQSTNPRLNLVPEGADKDVLYESDKALKRTDDKKAAPVIKPRIPPKKRVDNTGVDAGIAEGNKKSKSYPSVTRNFVPNEERAAIPYPAKAAADKKAADKAAADKRLKPSDVSGVGFGATSLSSIGRSAAAANEKAAKDRLNKFEERRKESKEREARRTQAQNKAKSGTSLRAPGSSMNLNDPYAMMLGSEFDPKRVVRENRSRMPGDKLEYKKGGSVKKMASGGSVKSASARADGCAIRGKTRA